VDLSDLTDGVLQNALQIDEIKLSSGDDITILKNMREADANSATILGPFQLDTMFPLEEIAENFDDALNNVLAGARLPGGVNQSIKDTIEEINNPENKAELEEVNASAFRSRRRKSNQRGFGGDQWCLLALHAGGPCASVEDLPRTEHSPFR
jgi:hypothetical protein